MAKPIRKNVRSVSSIEMDETLRRLKESLEQGDCCPGNDLINYTPNIDIYTHSDALVIEVEVPGVSIKDIDISLIRNNLLIKGTKFVDQDDSKGNYLCMERGFGKFYRAVEIPFPVDTKSIKASCENGILIIKAGKIADKRGKPTRIEIK
ncbi:MAG: Hsp20/alpha crystallin family protein [Thermodesulfobacteriota bacterium]